MSSKHHIIYVPGIGDDIYRIQGFLVWWWFIYGVRGHVHEMPWTGKGEYQPKHEKLLALIDKYANQGHKVSLVGASAGASAAINAYIARRDQINSVAIICGKINEPETISESFYSRNAAFKESMYALQENLKKLTASDKSKFRNYYTPNDQVVTYVCSFMHGVQEISLRPMRHGQAIIYSVSIGARKIIKGLKNPR